jgi:hypothetical protein
MSYKPKVLTVSEGGTSATSQTAYAVLCGGTTSTGAVQSIAGLGTSGYALTSNGAGALPTFQAQGGGSGLGYTFYMSNVSFSPLDSTTYYFRQGGSVQTSQIGSRIYIPTAGTISKCYLRLTCTTGSGESSSLYIRLNDTTDTLVSSAVVMNASPGNFSNTGLSIAVSAGDFIEFKLTTPAWSSNPTVVRLSVCAYLS